MKKITLLFLLMFSLCRSNYAQCPQTANENDGVSCTDDVFDSNTGLWDHIPNDLSCDDGNPCTITACDCLTDCFSSNAPFGTPCPDGACDGDGVCDQDLPVELHSFETRHYHNEIILIWQTATEENNTGFEIQKSKDSRDWESIDFVEGKGTTSEVQQYNYTDRKPYIGDNYYRLKQIDYDGQYEYSSVRHVLMTAMDNAHMTIFPNPSSGHFTLSLHNPKKKKANIKLFDSIGNLIWEQGFLESETEIYWEKDFDLPQREVYFVVTQVGDEVESQKVTVVDRM